VPQCEPAQARTKNLWVDSESVAYAVERKRIVGSFGDDPLGRLGESATLARATHAVPTLQNVDRIDEDREHQALFTAQSAATHPAEELARQNYVTQCQ
jgi:hypothetical protein